MLKKKHIRLLRKHYTCNKKMFSIKNNYMFKTTSVGKRNSIKKLYIFNFNTNLIMHGGLNVCSITGKYKTVFNSIRLSRHTIRFLCDTYNMPNYSKISWTCLN